MGSRTDARIAAWQEETGIKPAKGERAKLLQKISNAAFEPIKTIEHELCGIRDGNGHWYGSDAIRAVTLDLATLCTGLNDPSWGDPDCPVCHGDGWRSISNLGDDVPEDEQFDQVSRCPCHIHMADAA